MAVFCIDVGAIKYRDRAPLTKHTASLANALVIATERHSLGIDHTCQTQVVKHVQRCFSIFGCNYQEIDLETYLANASTECNFD